MSPDPPPPDATTVSKLESNPFLPAVESENGEVSESLPPSPPDPTVMGYLLPAFSCMSCEWTTTPPPSPPPNFYYYINYKNILNNQKLINYINIRIL